MKYKIYNQDVIEWAKEYQKGKFHALLCDAPYHLTSIVKRFGKKNSAPAKHGTDGVFSRSSKGFMGQQWDGGDIAFRPETWEALGEHLYPGAFGMAFSASRNWHRMAVAIEDAGFIIHPTIFGWLNGQGFPKATKLKGNETFAGHRYGLQALKPAVEPIIVFQKPYEGRPLDNIVETGAGALNIDGARIPLATDDEYTINTFDDGAKPWGNGAGHKYTSRKMRQSLPGDRRDAVGAGMFGEGTEVKTYPIPASGRWPANFILDESVAERLDAQTGILTSGSKKANESTYNHRGREFVASLGESQNEYISNSGGASRFFFNVQEQIDDADPIYYCGKVSPKERNAGLEDLPLVERRPSGDDWGKQTMWNGENGDEEWRKKNPNNPVRNPHPTLKPIALAKYLATLLLPPEAYAPRRILVPFSGVMSEAIGAALAGWERIVAIEFMEEYAEIGRKRMEHWTK